MIAFMAIPRNQAGFDDAFAAMVKGGERPWCGDLTDEDFGEAPKHGSRQGRLTVSDVDSAQLDRFDRVGDRWSRGELTLQQLVDEMERRPISDEE